jgi:hypothetical protein
MKHNPTKSDIQAAMKPVTPVQPQTLVEAINTWGIAPTKEQAEALVVMLEAYERLGLNVEAKDVSIADLQMLMCRHGIGGLSKIFRVTTIA